MNCCIPGCSYSHKEGRERRSLFSIRRPEFGKTASEKLHRTDLTNFILRLRDPLKGDNIKQLLHKEKATICEIHFSEDDFIVHNTRKSLKSGAMPKFFLPAKCKTTQKVIQYQKHYYISEQWGLVFRNNYLFLEYVERENDIQPSIRYKSLFEVLPKSIFSYLKLIYITICISLFSHSICLSLDLIILWVAFGGWRTDIAQFEVCNLKTTILKEFLVEVGGQRCYPCDKYDIKTKYNKKYTSLKNVQDDDLVTVDEDTHNDIIELYHKENDEMNDWQKMFFSNQCQNAKTSPKQRRYHPDVIRWAIELYARSPAAYNQLKTSGVLTLPSSKTLQQYRYEKVHHC
uniref:uncharacterized protein LOC108950141 n=1 Tax=Ciona intestinalis TaxID=7719 RepID=UPI000EF4F681|nr:uncharacterized protein LOC108950141 [Ciona intestinalis]|eukprot:XP_026693588.1 uncharacterized protein LOC108950141 [Ciona intestinalis]